MTRRTKLARTRPDPKKKVFSITKLPDEARVIFDKAMKGPLAHVNDMLAKGKGVPYVPKKKPNAFVKVGQWIGKAARNVWNTGKSIVTGVYNDVKGIVTKVVDTGTSVVTKVTDTGVGLVETAEGMGKGIIWIVGIGIGGFLLYSLLNPGSTERMVTAGIARATPF